MPNGRRATHKLTKFMHKYQIFSGAFWDILYELKHTMDFLFLCRGNIKYSSNRLSLKHCREVPSKPKWYLNVDQSHCGLNKHMSRKRMVFFCTSLPNAGLDVIKAVETKRMHQLFKRLDTLAICERVHGEAGALRFRCLCVASLRRVIRVLDGLYTMGFD